MDFSECSLYIHYLEEKIHLFHPAVSIFETLSLACLQLIHSSLSGASAWNTVCFCSIREITSPSLFTQHFIHQPFSSKRHWYQCRICFILMIFFHPANAIPAVWSSCAVFTPTCSSFCFYSTSPFHPTAVSVLNVLLFLAAILFTTSLRVSASL